MLSVIRYNVRLTYSPFELLDRNIILTKCFHSFVSRERNAFDKFASRLMDLLLTQYCSKPHCPHLAGELEPHWHPPLTQQAQLWLLDDDDATAAGMWCEDAFAEFSLMVELPPFAWFSFSNSQAHPLGFLVHKST